jgi:hypothetical protein
VSSDTANVRNAPSGTVVMTLMRGAMVSVRSVSGDWYSVRFTQGSTPDCANNELGLRVCDTATRRCVQCVPTRDACPTGQYCGTDNRCATGCRDDQACAASVTDAGVDDAGVARGGRCNPQTRACVDCLSNEHCPLGQLCMGSQCVPGCDTQRGCAEGRACCGGGCIDVQTSPIHCGACGTVCATVNGTPACVAGRCGVGRCNAPFGDCDGDGANGCETNTQSTPAHCGACGMACPAVTNGTAACSAGRCVVGQCTQGFADCDGDASNGCETNLNTTLSDCGRCGNACNVEGGSAVCAAGVCQRSACNMGRGDCDGNTANGCETELDSDPRNCRVCGNACNVPNATAACIGGGCAVGTCNTGFGNCDGNTQNGCESNLRNNLEHCGACGVSCAFARATAACTDGACAIAACEQGFGNCDGMTSTGCETSTSNNPAHCGTCGTVCPSPPGATAACNNATCGFTCNTGLADCDSNTANGCEQDTVSNVNHCGGCNRRCVLPNADASCTAGACRVLRCLPGFADCDGNASNGCETQGACVYSACSAVPRTRPSGVYTLNSGGSAWQAYCDMTTDGGGWTLLLKVDGAATTFQYDSALWTNTALLNESATNTTRGEAKFRGFLNLAFTAVRVVMRDGADRGLTLPLAASSLQSLFAGGARSTTAGRGAWRGLVSSPSLQPFCNAEGVNQSVPGYRRVRLGILTNQENECGSPDSGLGVGFGNDSNGCVTSAFAATAAGNVATCGSDDGDRNTQLFTMLFVR